MIKPNVSYKRINQSSSVTLSRLVDHGLRLYFSSVKRWSRVKFYSLSRFLWLKSFLGFCILVQVVSIYSSR